MGSHPASARQELNIHRDASTGVGGGNSGASRLHTTAKPATTPKNLYNY
jgi:hypothetical protein